MAALSQLETALSDVFVKKAPKLPEGAKRFIVTYLPYINLVFGVLALWAAWAIYNWANYASEVTDYLNSYSRALGGTDVVSRDLTVGLWLAIIVLVIEAVLYIAAFAGTRDRKKSGWDLLFYALLVNAVYGVVVVFTSYGGFGNLLGALIGTVIGLYFLFQIRSSYS